MNENLYRARKKNPHKIMHGYASELSELAPRGHRYNDAVLIINHALKSVNYVDLIIDSDHWTALDTGMPYTRSVKRRLCHDVVITINDVAVTINCAVGATIIQA